MLTVKCPACATALKLKAAPPSGKVKCPKCGGVVAVGAKSPTAGRSPSPSSPVTAGASKALDPDDEGFDFGRISFPSVSSVNAVSQFPSNSKLAVYDGPIPGDPLEFIQEDESGEAPAPTAGQPQSQRSAKKRNPMILVGVIGGVLVLVIVCIAAAVMLGGGSS